MPINRTFRLCIPKGELNELPKTDLSQPIDIYSEWIDASENGQFSLLCHLRVQSVLI